VSRRGGIEQQMPGWLRHGSRNLQAVTPIAHVLAVPMQADSVLSPRLVYTHVAPFTHGAGETDALYFPLRHPETGEGRVTFEGLDSVRACRGEQLAYTRAASFERGDWAYEISNSPWLLERDAYETEHYQTPLVGSYRHDLFSFHDEYIEVIARGIWFDRPDPENPSALSVDHPLADLDRHAPQETRQSPSGIAWETRRNPKSESTLIEASKLCSQRLYQFNLILDGRSRESASVWLRTVDGRTTSFMERPWAGGIGSRDGLASPGDFLDDWEDHVAAVAARRQAMGKPMS
jgi:hypothetical protein